MRFLRFLAKTCTTILAVHENVNPVRLMLSVMIVLVVALEYLSQGYKFQFLIPILTALSFFLLGSNWLAVALHAQVKESPLLSAQDEMALDSYVWANASIRLAIIITFALAFGKVHPWLMLLWCAVAGLITWIFAYRVSGRLMTTGPRSQWVKAMRDLRD